MRLSLPLRRRPAEMVIAQPFGEMSGRYTAFGLKGHNGIDFTGPQGWEHSATNLGRVSSLSGAPGEGVLGRQRRVLPVVEVRADFALSRDELRDADRGADDTDLKALDDAAHQVAVSENVAVFHGFAEAGMKAGVGHG